MTTTVLSEGAASVRDETSANRFNWGAVFAGAAVAIATGFFLTLLGAGFGLTLMPRGGSTTFLTLGAIWVLAAQAFGFAAGGHVTGRLIGQAVETKKEEEIRAGAHGLVVWAVTVAGSLALLAIVAAGGGARLHGDGPRSESSISAYWADILLHPMGPHDMARGEDLAQDKLEAGRVLAADLHPGNSAHSINSDDLIRLTMKNAGGSMPKRPRRGWTIVEGRNAPRAGYGAQGRRLFRAVDGPGAAVRRSAGSRLRHFCRLGRRQAQLQHGAPLLISI